MVFENSSHGDGFDILYYTHTVVRKNTLVFDMNRPEKVPPKSK